MKRLRNVMIIMIIALLVFIVIYQMNSSPVEVVREAASYLDEDEETIEPKGTAAELPQMNLEGDLYQWIGKTSNELTEELGEPDRIDVSAYNYEWYVYNDSESQYGQFAILEDEIVSVYAIGDNLEISPIDSGADYIEVADTFPFLNEVTYTEGDSSFTFRLNTEDLQTRPLVKISDSTFIQFYFDTFTEKLSSMRISTGDALLLQRPYEIEYQGDLPEQPEFNEEEWREIQEGMEQQVFDISNIMRYKHDLPQLEWDDQVSLVAYDHSKDMYENDYFSHVSLDGDGLRERLEEKQVAYVAAGENIAAQYPDAPAAMEGWLNSESHREALLSDEYSFLGVGVYRFYYTQNFLGKPF
ncbi:MULTISPECIES: CAP domain-containing protein [Oceanobacillus]|uniref:CAP domain-containing protein n=1 Tax=Oceanobacillus aidingensis TaxID=645964 RepID=A0ABV9K1N7_9BACI|nr:CAP domain-containing protein [Oceanobacillus oncorhynchi]MDM8100835.1 CAP domain-containing protein [Oceanobacillus oncorhynchi]